MITNNIVSIVTWLPALGAVLILGLFKKEQNHLIKKFATAWLVLDFAASLWLFGYNRGLGGMQFLEDHQWIPVIGARWFRSVAAFISLNDLQLTSSSFARTVAPMQVIRRTTRTIAAMGRTLSRWPTALLLR